MRRVLLLGLVAGLTACGGSGSAVAHVAGTTVTRSQLQDAVDHFKDEAAAEARPFPKPGTDAFRTAERQVLALLVYRAELLRSAAKLGVGVSDAQVEARLASAGGEGEDAGAFARETVRAQLAYEHVYAKVTAGLPAGRRDAAMRRWLRHMKLEYEVSYEDGFGPAA